METIDHHGRLVQDDQVLERGINDPKLNEESMVDTEHSKEWGSL